jgi:hypothetical protein
LDGFVKSSLWACLNADVGECENHGACVMSGNWLQVYR